MGEGGVSLGIMVRVPASSVYANFRHLSHGSHGASCLLYRLLFSLSLLYPCFLDVVVMCVCVHLLTC